MIVTDARDLFPVYFRLAASSKSVTHRGHLGVHAPGHVVPMPRASDTGRVENAVLYHLVAAQV